MCGAPADFIRRDGGSQALCSKCAAESMLRDFGPRPSRAPVIAGALLGTAVAVAPLWVALFQGWVWLSWGFAIFYTLDRLAHLAAELKGKGSK